MAILFWRRRKVPQLAVKRSPRKVGARTVHRLGLEPLEPRLAPATFWVTSTEDSGPGSLRQAILDANSNAGPATIAFAIGKGGVQTIMPTSALPTITQPVEIDGRSQRGSKGQPLIELTGTNAGSQANGLTITAGNSTVRGLVVNRFGGFGIFVERKGNNRIIGNYLGTDVTGAVDRGNHLAGLAMWNQSDGNIVGGTSVDSRNLISANSFAGISISSARENLIEGNYIGTDATGIQPLGNGRIPNGAGVDIFAGSDNIVGGAAPGAGNLISANWGGSIALSGVHQIVQGNYLGTDWTGAQSTRALSGGIFLNGRNHLIGGTAPGAGNLIVGTVEFGANEGGNSVQGNYIGTDVTGTHLLGIGGRVTVRGQNNVIGGTTPGARNIIAGSNDFRADPAVNVLGDHNRIQGNYIGTDVTGTVALGNQTQGIALGDPSFGGGNDNLIGGTEPGAGNVVSGNGTGALSFGEGIAIYGSRNTIQGNYVGTDASGTRALPNLHGIALGSIFNVPTNDNVIGGAEPGAGNLVSGNAGTGIRIAGRFNRVQGNAIGVDVTGAAVLPNTFGVVLNGADNVIGGTEVAAGNVISGNRMDGVVVDADRGVIQGNWIGTDRTGTDDLGNSQDGVTVGSLPGNSNQIGGTEPGAGNVIAFNGRDGVRVFRSTNIAIRGNSMYGNGNLGIDLVDGGNHNQEAPQLYGVWSAGQALVVVGSMSSTPQTTFVLEWFGNSVCHPSGYGEGERPLAAVTVTSDDDGWATFAVLLIVDDPGSFLTATATDPDGNTSAFSACVEVHSAKPAETAALLFDVAPARPLPALGKPSAPLLAGATPDITLTELRARRAKEIVFGEESPISPRHWGERLLDPLTKEEIADLFAFMESEPK